MNIRQIALNIIHATLEAVNPQTAVKTYLKRNGTTLICSGQTYNLADYERLRVIGFGKGSAPMAQAVHELFSDQVTDGLVIVKYGHTLPPEVKVDPIQIVEAGHPVPDENSLVHTKTLIDFLADSTERDLILCLISGGGSALLTQPAIGLTLSQIQAITQHLLGAGADITEINTIRKHLSAVKGGRLAKLAAPATIISLILSDVGGDKLDMIASGPTVPDPTTYADALALLEKYKLMASIDSATLTYLRHGAAGQHPETPKPGDPAFENITHVIISNNQMAAVAALEAAQGQNFNAASFGTFIEGEASEVARRVANLARMLNRRSDLIQKPAALIFGGETTVTLGSKPGLGGRNQELALACALHIQDESNLLIATLATDGNDGPTDAAGAFVDGQTVSRAAAQGLNAQAYLDQHDSYHFFQALDDLIITGPTNTNVNDLILIFTW